MSTLFTERLELRRWQLQDFEPFAELCAQPEVMRFLGVDGKPLSRFDAWRAFAGLTGHWHLRGYGIFAVFERASGNFVGRVGPWFPEGWPDFEVGWTLRSEFWGKGYATEAAEKCLEYAFTDLDRQHVSSFIDPRNLASIRVAEKIGERLEGTVLLPHVPDRGILQYGLSRAEWQNRAV